MNLFEVVPIEEIQANIEGDKSLVIQLNRSQITSENAYFSDIRLFFDTLEHISPTNRVYIESDMDYDELLLEIGNSIIEEQESVDHFYTDEESEMLAVAMFNHFSFGSNVHILAKGLEYVVDTEKGEEFDV